MDIPRINMINTKNYDEFEGYPSFCDYGRKIHVDCAYNLQFPCMIGFKQVSANFFPILPIDVISKDFYNSIMKNKIEYGGKNVVGIFMNVPIFVGNLTIVTDFTMVENMDAYRDVEMGDVIVGKPFCKEVKINDKRFEGKITFQSGSNVITYMMPRAHPRFKHAPNKFCYKFTPFLFVDKNDADKRIEYPYQKMKGFYKGVLELEPEYVCDEVIRNYIVHGHVGINRTK